MKSTLFLLHGEGYDPRMATLKPQDEFIKTALRLPRDLHKRVQETAGAAGRSMNSEIIQALQSYYDDVDREEWENDPERLQQDFNEAEAEIVGISVSQLHAQRRVQDQIRKQLTYLRNHIAATSQRLLSLQTMRQAMLTERAVSGGGKAARQDDPALAGVEERIRSTEADLDESQLMFKTLLPLDPDNESSPQPAETPKERPSAALQLPKIMSKEIEDLLEQIRRKQIADLLAKK